MIPLINSFYMNGINYAIIFACLIGIILGLAGITTSHRPRKASVSYTHLDVYKRQILRRVSKSRRGTILPSLITMTCWSQIRFSYMFPR